ncbi:transposase [Streptomyces sp. ISL-98]|nr:transposase [Streptomyces sp. ISL-98]
MQGIGSRPRVYVSADGAGVVGHAGARLLADLADATGLTSAYSIALGPLRPRGTGHDPGRLATDLAVMLADGGEAITDLAVLRDQGEVFGQVASTPTAWRLLADVDEGVLDRLRSARAQAREVAWLQAAETRSGIPAVKAGGRELPGLVLDIDATLITCHSEKDQAAPTYKGGFGFHPLVCFLANTGEGMSGRLRPGHAGANTAADHISVLDNALAQIPDAHRHGTDILVRADSAGSAKAFLAHVRDVRTRGIHTFFWVGYAVIEPVRRAIRALPEQVWHHALDQDGTLRVGAAVAELTGTVDLADYPEGTRIIVRRERPHPGAQLSLFDQDEGLRHQVFLTDTPFTDGGSAQFRRLGAEITLHEVHPKRLRLRFSKKGFLARPTRDERILQSCPDATCVVGVSSLSASPHGAHPFDVPGFFVNVCRASGRSGCAEPPGVTRPPISRSELFSACR